MLDGACDQPGVDEVLQEERVAAAQPAEQPNRLGGELAAAEAGGHVRPHCVTTKGAERQLRAAAPDPEALDQLANMVVAGPGVRVRVRPDHEQAGRLVAQGERLDEVEGRVVGPVEVVEHEHDRTLLRQRLQRLDHLAEHRVPGRSQ